MRLKPLFFIFFSSLIISSCSVLKRPQAKQLFILSGQSNMGRLDLNLSFIPALEEELGKENILIVKDAKGGQPISRWYKKAQPNSKEKRIGDLYDQLLSRVKDSIANTKIESITFIWMQGERDANLANAAVYEEYLTGLYKQLSEDLDRKDINFIIGRLSDFDMNNETYPHWTKIRSIQVKVAESSSNFDWVNTDDFNDGLNSKGKEIENDLHMSVEGYKRLGQAFARKAIRLLKVKAAY